MCLKQIILLCIFLVNVSSSVEQKVISCKVYTGDSLETYFQDVFNNTNDNSFLEACRTDDYEDLDTKVSHSTLLVTATTLSIKNVLLSSLPATSLVTDVEMFDVTPCGGFGGCSNLTHLFIRGVNLTLMSPNWLANCTQLKVLELHDLSASQVDAIMETVSRLETLKIKNVLNVHNILALVSSFKNGDGLQWLKNLSMEFDSSPKLEGENTTWAEVSALLTKQLATLPRLEHLTISGLRKYDFCSPGQFSSLDFKSLRYLNISLTSTSRLCFRHLRVMPQIKYMNLWRNEILILQFSELHSTLAPRFELAMDSDYTYSQEEYKKFYAGSEYGSIPAGSLMPLTRFVEFIFTRDDYMNLSNGSQKGNVTITDLQSSMSCDCNGSLWLARAMHEGLVYFGSETLFISCEDGTSIRNQTCERLQCNRVNCDSPCVCCRDEARNGIFADCRGVNLTTFPIDLLNLPNLTELLVPNNSISVLPDRLPRSLRLLDLSGNRIRRLSAEIVSTLFDAPERRIRLAGNPIDCSCDNRPLLSALQHYQDTQVDDEDGIECEHLNTKVAKLSVSALCLKLDVADAKQRESNLILIVAVTVVASVIALTLIAGYYYRREIQIILYGHGWCLWCIQEDKLDADRYYDVFLSYCHEDEEFVLENLLPALDREYSVCIHNRDWCPGGQIPTQIAISVEQSRRTVVVVSKNFPQSLWGMLEFRTAYASSLEERRARVVLLVLDDVLQQARLEGDLRSYVRFNTYLQWGDPWFWHKLRFALPHRPTRRAPPPCQSALNQPQVVVEEAEDINDVFQHNTSRRETSPFQSALNEPQRIVEADILNDEVSHNPTDQAPSLFQGALNQTQSEVEEAEDINSES